MKVHFVSFVICLVGLSNCQVDKQFRSDYEYYNNANGWFKFNLMPLNWQEARLRCAYEGAILASPTDDGIASYMLNVTNHYKVRVYTGFHATVSNGDFHSIDGKPLDDTKVKWLAGNPNNHGGIENCLIYHPNGVLEDIDCAHPFQYICFKPHSKNMILTECGTIDKKYKLDRRTNQCYKFHRIGRSYKVAAAVCSGEGGHLAIINSDIEAEVLKDLFAEYPSSSIPSNQYRDGARLGFYNWNTDSSFFGTLHGQSLEEAGYERWGPNEPSHSNGGKQSCGGMFRNGLLDDTHCDDYLAFFCEKDPYSLISRGLDERLGD